MIGLIVLVACGAGAPRTLDVLAASSLTEGFADLEGRFEAAHPDVDVRLVFGGSQALAAQVAQGLPADVFASADARQLDRLGALGLAAEGRSFAENRLVIAVGEGTRARVDLEQLPAAGRVVVGAEEVPVGQYTRATFDAAEARFGAQWRAALEQAVVSRESNVRLVLAKVQLGEADAAVVYATDARAAGLRAVELPSELAPTAVYRHARLRGAREPELAEAWMALVEGEAGRAALRARGFTVGGAP